MPRFVILAHDWPTAHWDLLLEAGPVLKAWRLLAEPVPGRTISAEPNYDHRLLYLDFEGPLSGTRGAVTRWDAGTFAGDLESNGWEIELAGSKVHGKARLRKLESGWVFAMG